MSVSRQVRVASDAGNHRNAIGLDVALEALRAYRCRMDFKLDEVWNYAWFADGTPCYR